MKYLTLLILAALLFATKLVNPIDGFNRNVWREADTGAIARNFYEEDMNVFYPRIDWRGAGPGYVEAEFPFQSWLGAGLYSIFGYHEWLLRLIAFIATLGSCWVFFLIARLLLPEKAAFLASFLFVLHPLVFLLSTAIQPEPLMLLGYLVGIYSFLRWIQTDSLQFYILALFATTFAILAKLPSAHIGVFFVLLAFDRYGLRAFTVAKLWIFALITLGIPFLWYEHARSLWLQYGNSLGISNEALARLGNVNIWGNILVELKTVWFGFGLILAIFGFTSHSSKILIFWGISLLFYYLASGATTGEMWAYYYHVVTVPWACLLIAQGFYFLKNYIAQFCLFAFILCELGVTAYAAFIRKPAAYPYYLSAQKLSQTIPKDALIIANGLSTIDENGQSVAGNSPYLFFWLNRKGFTLHQNHETMSDLMRMKNEGAKYFVIEKTSITRHPEFYKEVFDSFPVIAETDAVSVVRLDDVK